VGFLQYKTLYELEKNTFVKELTYLSLKHTRAIIMQFKYL